MNNACPQCGKTYAVSAEHVGRKVTCKQCQSKLVVGPDGLEMAGSAPPPPPPAEEGSPFGFGGGNAYTPSYSPPPPPPPPSGGGYSSGGAGYASEEEEPARPKKRGAIGEYLTFRRFIVPTLIQIIFWLEVLIILGGAAVMFGMTVVGSRGEIVPILISGVMYLIGVPIGILLARIYCELLILGFRLLDSMNEVRDAVERMHK